MKFQENNIAVSWWKLIEGNPKLAWGVSILWLVIISWVAFLSNLGSVGLVDKTEPMFVEAARQMSVTGDWVTPYWNGETRFDKPPLVYWLMAIAFKLMGTNELAARLPSALGAIALTILGFYTLRCFGISRPATVESDNIEPNPQRQLWLSAWIGAALIALNPAWIAWGRTAVSDMLLASCMAMALLAFFVGYAQSEQEKAQKRTIEQEENFTPFPQLPIIPASAWYLAFYVLAALAVLAKGPVGIVLPVLIIGAFLLYVGKGWEVWREMQPLRGSLIFFAIALPWFILVTLANGKAYIDTFFGYHNVQRFTSVVSNHPGPWYYYFIVVLVGLAPWSIFLPVALARLRFWQRKRWLTTPRSTHLGLFALFWIVAVVGFFSIAVTKLPSYVLPMMPAGAILITLFWSDQMVASGERQNRLLPQRHTLPILLSSLVNVGVLFALAAASFYSPSLIGEDPAAPEVSQVLQQSGLPMQAGIIWAIAAIFSTFLLVKRRLWRWLWISNLAGLIAFMIFVAPPAVSLLDTQRQLPLRQLSVLTTQALQPGEEIIMLGFIRPSVIFYTQHNVTHISSPENLRPHLESLKNVQSKPISVLVLSQSEDLEDTELQPNQYTSLGRAGAYELIRVSER